MKIELYRILFILLGTIQVLANLVYLSMKNGLSYARKQHQELPQNLSDHQIKTKVVCMLVFGALFLLTGILSSILLKTEILFLIVLILFAIYALIEAIYYRYWRTYGFMVVSFILLILFLVL